MKEEVIICLKQIAAFLKVQAGKITQDEEGTVSRMKNNTTTIGIFNIINEFIIESKSTVLGGVTPEEKALVRQWIEYAIVYVTCSEGFSSIYDTLNFEFLKKTYLLRNKFSIADIVLYYIIQNKMDKLTYLEKEKYINLCRWFDNMQQNPSIRQSNSMIDFNTIYLATVVPAKH